MALFIQVSAVNLPLLPRLLHSIHHQLNTYALHFEKNFPADALEPTVFGIRVDGRKKKVFLVPEEAATYRGIFMFVNCFSAMILLLVVDHGWTYFIHISGSDYQFVSRTDQRRLLATPGVADARVKFAYLELPKAQVAPWAEQRIGHLFVDTSLAFWVNDTVVTTKPPG